MQYAKLGRTGLSVSRICLGCMSYGDKKWRDWVLTVDEAREHFAAALEAGINFFDTANVYSLGVSEEITGRWLGEMVRREDIVLATKVHGPMAPGQNRGGLSRKNILEACDASLRRLKMDFIDLYQIHRFDFATPLEETLEALDSLVRAGKVRYLGASSMAAWQFQKALALQKENGWHRFVAMQNHYNLVYREEEREMNPLCLDQGVGLIPWSPLARGFLAGNRDRQGSGETARAKSDEFAKNMYFREYDFAVLDAVEKIAKKRGATPSQVACAWILQAPGVTAPIIGATKLKHLQEAIKAVDLKLSEDEIAEVERPYRPHPILGHTQPEPRRMAARAG
jgi:1-deoxyxylulose-5-phosphate synthase